MVTATYDTQMIRTLNMFESLTDVEARDCIINDEEAYFIVPEGKAGMAIGKGGKVVQKVQDQLGKTVKIYEYHDNVGAFVNNLVPGDIRGVTVEDEERHKKVSINVPNSNKGKVLGREGERIETIREVLARTHNVDEVKVE
ncbi:NusA-like transcription termination signal-binding factor [Nanohaloarchaea archaeon H01]|jgi:N utilization substance protein A|nr:NusA-like transcription termination signal-binding factor [Nanohaloarchaea archaeon H01]